MADYTVDARGLSCPEPVVRTKKAFDAHQNFTVLVDNETSKENVIRFCDKMKAKTSVSADGSDFHRQRLYWPQNQSKVGGSGATSSGGA